MHLHMCVILLFLGCERDGEGKLYPPGHVLPEDDCTNLVCENGHWAPKPTDAAGKRSYTYFLD